MSKKTLWILVVLLAVLAGAMWMIGRRASAPAGKSPAAGGALLPSVDMNTVRAIAIEDGAATTHLAKVEGIWCVAEQDGYPADFNRLREMMRSIDGTENVQVAEEGSAHLAEFGLAAGEESAPLGITLEHEQGTTVLSLGKMREPRQSGEAWMPPAGRYVRVDAGPVLLIKEDIRMAAADPAQWWERLLLEVPPESIRQVEIGSGDGSFAIERGTNGTFTSVGASEGEEVNVEAASRLFDALRNLRAEQILPAGGQESEAAFTNALTYKAEAEGATYRIQMGEARSDMGGGRPVKIEVAATSDATPEQQTTVAAMEKKLNSRKFLIPVYQADSLGLKKDALVHKPAAVPEPPPVPEESVPAESTPETNSPDAP